jgi:hypothetical protein
MDNDYSISALPSRKDLIEHPLISQNGILPNLTQSAYFVGSSGSGKSNLCATLLSDPRFFGTTPHAWDRIVWISPTLESDDTQNCLRDFPNVPLAEEDCISDLTLVDSFLTELRSNQADIILKNGSHRSPKVLIVLDDVIVEKTLLALPVVRTLFISGRHSNCAVWVCSQSYNLLPRSLRLQCNWLFVFSPSMNESEVLAFEIASSILNKKSMLRLISFATSKKYEFLTFSRLAESGQRYRKGLSEVIDLGSL